MTIRMPINSVRTASPPNQTALDISPPGDFAFAVVTAIYLANRGLIPLNVFLAINLDKGSGAAVH
jgi:hypothetical protein